MALAKKCYCSSPAACCAARSVAQRREHLALGARAAEGSRACPPLPRRRAPADWSRQGSLAVRLSSDFPWQMMNLPWPRQKTFFATAINRSENGEAFWHQKTTLPSETASCSRPRQIGKRGRTGAAVGCCEVRCPIIGIF